MTAYVYSGLLPTQRVTVSISMANQEGSSEWSADTFMVTDPDRPAPDLPPECVDIASEANASRLQYYALYTRLANPEGYGEPVDRRQLRIFDLGFGLGGPLGVRPLMTNASAIGALSRVDELTDGAALRVLNISANASQLSATFALVDDLQPNTCYRLQVSNT